MEFKIHSAYSWRPEGYQIFLDGEQVHFTKDKYECDMFMAELKTRLKLLSQTEKTDS